MTFDKFCDKIRELLFHKDNPREKQVRAIVRSPDEPNRTIELGLKDIIVEEYDVTFVLEFKEMK